MPVMDKPANNGDGAHKVAPEHSSEFVDAVRKTDRSTLKSKIKRFKTFTQATVFMEYDIQLFDVNREQYRRCLLYTSPSPRDRG